MTRHSLGTGGTSIGGAGAVVPLEGVGQDLLKLVPGPWRVTFQGSGPPPFCAGAALTECELKAGLRVEWAGILIVYRVAAALTELASLELEPPVVSPMSSGVLPSGLEPPEETAWLRVRAGLLVDTGQAESSVVKHWQAEVMGGVLDVGACAAELNAAVPVVDDRVVERAGRLMRDFLMSSKLKGAAGAARASRRAAKTMLGMLLSQLIALGCYSLIVFGCMIFIRHGGYSFDALYDSILVSFGLK